MSGVADVVADLWRRVRAELRRVEPAAAVEPALEPWLAQVEPVALREGTLELLTRSPRSVAHLRQRLLPLLERAVRRVLGAPVRVRIDVDQSLGGALLALGVPMAPPPPAPPPFVARPETRLAQ